MIFKAASFHDSFINIKLSYDARCGNQNFILLVESMFNRSGEGYASPISQNLITRQTASSTRGKFSWRQCSWMFVEKKKLLAYCFLLRHRTGYEMVGLLKDTFNPPSSTVRAEGFECTGASTETSLQYTATAILNP
jgi:hypothetical protein